MKLIHGDCLEKMKKMSDESVDMKWVETYGADKVEVVKKYEEPESGGDDES